MQVGSAHASATETRSCQSVAPEACFDRITFTFVPTNANDGNLTTYWEGGAGYPQDLFGQPHQPRARAGQLDLGKRVGAGRRANCND